MRFDVYITGYRIENTEYGPATIPMRFHLFKNISYKRLKGKLRLALNIAGRSEAYTEFVVYPAHATPDQFYAYDLLTDDQVPLYNEFIETRLRTGNFDPHKRWKSK